MERDDVRFFECASADVAAVDGAVVVTYKMNEGGDPFSLGLPLDLARKLHYELGLAISMGAGLRKDD
jgi:hypothetical protein